MFASATGDDSAAPGNARLIDSETSSNNTVGMVIISRTVRFAVSVHTNTVKCTSNAIFFYRPPYDDTALSIGFANSSRKLNSELLLLLLAASCQRGFLLANTGGRRSVPNYPVTWIHIN